MAWAILTQRSRGIRSGLVCILLKLRDPNELAVLAMIVTFTPGTAWAQCRRNIAFLATLIGSFGVLRSVFNALTAPVTTIFLMRAAVFRGRIRGEVARRFRRPERTNRPGYDTPGALRRRFPRRAQPPPEQPSRPDVLL